MAWRTVWRTVAVALAGVTGACALLVDTDDLTAGGARAAGAPEAGAVDGAVDGATADAATDGRSDGSADAGPPRVTDGLVALFEFRETGGTVVHDTAPDGDHLELFVERAPAPDGDGGTLPPATSGPTVTWMAPGLSVVGRVIIASAANATTVRSRCDATNELTVEAWVKPASLLQGGPARIVTMSLTGTTRNRNFTLAQDGDDFVFRLRNEDIDAGYIQRNLDGGVKPALTHVAVTARANGPMSFWVDGARTSFSVPEGAFNFKPFRLALANEIDGYDSERLWMGDLHLIAIYCRVLSEAELTQNRAAGPPR